MTGYQDASDHHVNYSEVIVFFELGFKPSSRYKLKFMLSDLSPLSHSAKCDNRSFLFPNNGNKIFSILSLAPTAAFDTAVNVVVVDSVVVVVAVAVVVIVDVVSVNLVTVVAALVTVAVVIVTAVVIVAADIGSHCYCYLLFCWCSKG